MFYFWHKIVSISIKITIILFLFFMWLFIRKLKGEGNIVSRVLNIKRSKLVLKIGNGQYFTREEKKDINDGFSTIS